LKRGVLLKQAHEGQTTHKRLIATRHYKKMYKKKHPWHLKSKNSLESLSTNLDALP